MLTRNQDDISSCIANLSNPDPEEKQKSIERLIELAKDKNSRKMIPAAEAITRLVSLLKEKEIFTDYRLIRNEQIKHKITWVLCLLLEPDSTKINQNDISLIVDAGGLKPLIPMLNDDFLYLYPLNLLYFIASNESNRSAIVAAGAIKPLIKLLSNDHLHTKTIVAKSLGFLAQENPEHQNMIRESYGIDPLLQTLREAARYRALKDTDQDETKTTSPDHTSTCTIDNTIISTLTALGHLTKRNPHNQNEVIRSKDIIDYLATSLSHDHEQIRENAFYVLGILTQGRDDIKSKVLDTSGVAPLIVFLNSSSSACKQNATITLGSMAFNESNQNKIRQAGAIELIVRLLSEAECHTRQHAAWALIRLTKRNIDNQSTIISAGGIPLLIKLAISDTDMKTRGYSARLLRLIANNNIEIYDTINNANPVDFIMQLLAFINPIAQCNAAQILTVLVFSQRYQEMSHQAYLKELLSDLISDNTKLQNDIETAMAEMPLTPDEKETLLDFLQTQKSETSLTEVDTPARVLTAGVFGQADQTRLQEPSQATARTNHIKN